MTTERSGKHSIRLIEWIG